MNRQSTHSLKAISAYISMVIVAGLLMMWGTMNFVTNIMVFIQGESDQNWLLSGILVLLTALAPFFFGLWIVLRLLTRSQPDSSSNQKG